MILRGGSTPLKITWVRQRQHHRVQERARERMSSLALSKEEICHWANTSDSKRNFKEGKRIINAGHIIYCGKNKDFNGSVGLRRCVTPTVYYEVQEK